MRAYVFNDAALAKHAGRFVWLEIDTEKPENAAFLARYPIEVWPTLLVVDAAAERAVLRWPGSANAEQLGRLLDDGERAARPPSADEDGDRAASALARADRLGAEQKTAEATAALREALATATPEQRPRLVERLILSLLAAHDEPGCADVAVKETAQMPRGPSFANVAATGLYCAEALPISLPEKRGALAAMEPLAREALALPGLLADDRSGLYEVLVDARAEAGDKDGARALATAWLAFLEAEAARAPSAEARAVFDPHRVVAALKAGDPARAISALEMSERDLPADYNAPARLALVLKELGRHDEALAAIDRALARVYGPRRVRLLENKAAIYEAKGDAASARRTIEEALRAAESLPPGRAHDALVEKMRTKLR